MNEVIQSRGCMTTSIIVTGTMHSLNGSRIYSEVLSLRSDLNIVIASKRGVIEG
jgi:hypothetical protein